MLPLLNKLETYHPDAPDKSKHGYDGPVNISDGGYRGKSEEQFLQTCKDMGYKAIDDLQDLESCGGFGVSTEDVIFREH